MCATRYFYSDWALVGIGWLRPTPVLWAVGLTHFCPIPKYEPSRQPRISRHLGRANPLGLRCALKKKTTLCAQMRQAQITTWNWSVSSKRFQRIFNLNRFRYVRANTVMATPLWRRIRLNVRVCVLDVE